MLTWLRGCALAYAVMLVPAAFAAPASASAADAVQLVRQRLRLSPVLQGAFEQTKTLTGFRNPLVSSGDFLVAQGQGVWWHTRQPFDTTLVMTRTRLFSRNPDGSASNLMDAQAAPGLEQVNALIFSLLAADLDALAARFDLASQPVGADGWTLVLTPRDASVAKFLVRATLTGEREVRTVHIDETRGDITSIRFSGTVRAPSLTPDEAARFR